MSDNKSGNSLPPEDIDLLVLIERTVLFFRKYLWLFVIAAFLGLGFGFLNWLRLPKVYKSRLILHSFTLSNQDYLQIVDNWNSLLRKNGRDELAQSFGISREALGKVKEMKGSEIQKVFTQNNPNGFYIDVYVTDNAVLEELQRGILTGMENVDFINRQLTIKRNNLVELISDVEREITKLDSTKARIEKMIGSKTGYSSTVMIDISGLNKQLIELNEKLLFYRQDLKLTSAVQVLQGFSKFNRPDGPRLIVWLGLGLIGFLGIAYIIALSRSLKSKIRARAASSASVK